MSERDKKRDFHPRKELKQQLESLQERGQTLHYEQDVPLTAEDISLIRRLFFKITLFCLALCVPFALAIYFFQNEEMIWIIGGVAILCFLFVVGRAGYQLASNLRAGKKTIVRGIITDRFSRKEYSAADEDGKREEKMVCYFKVGTREFRVDRMIYGDHKVGEAIELHYIVNQSGKPYFLHHLHLPDAGLT